MKEIVLLETIIIITQYFIIRHLIKLSKKIDIPIQQEKILCKKKFQQTHNILFIGNSISSHGVCEYWWGNWGMAASTKEKDYVHLLANKMSEKENITITTYNFYNWEVNAHDRSQNLPILNSLFHIKYKYIIIQLGENVYNITTFYKDLLEMVKYIQCRNKKAKIVIVGNFWTNHQLDNYKDLIAKDTNAIFINLQSIDNNDYYAQIGTSVYGKDNNIHIIEHIGVAKHPNDKAMEYIAQSIYEKISKEK